MSQSSVEHHQAELPVVTVEESVEYSHSHPVEYTHSHTHSLAHGHAHTHSHAHSHPVEYSDSSPPLFPCISACDLHHLLSSHHESSVSIVDVRPFPQYAASHIKGAVDVALSCILLRRLAKGTVCIWDMISLKHKASFRASTLTPQSPRRVIVYDSSSTHVGDKNSTLRLFLEGFQREGISVCFLRGGFDAFTSTGNAHHVQGQASSPPPLLLQRPKPSKPCMSAPPVAPITLTSSSTSTTTLSYQSGGAGSVFSFTHTASSSRLGLPTSSTHTHCSSGGVYGQAISRVSEHVYVGSMDDARNRSLLNALNIGFVLNVTSDCPNYFEDDGIVYMNVPIDDTWQQNISSYFSSAIDFINLAKGSQRKVLVHCKAGVSRSPTIVIAYLMHACKMTLSEAYSTVRAVRPFISPNLDFMGHLVQFQKTLEGRRDSRSDLISLSLVSSTPTSSEDEDALALEGMDGAGGLSAVGGLGGLGGARPLSALFGCGPASPAGSCHSPLAASTPVANNSMVFS